MAGHGLAIYIYAVGQPRSPDSSASLHCGTGTSDKGKKKLKGLQPIPAHAIGQTVPKTAK